MRRREFLARSAVLGGVIMGASQTVAAERTAELFQIDGAPALQMRRLAAPGRPPVLYVHGGTFPSALAVGYRFADGVAWEDSLHAAGFDAWAVDFSGFGGSARPAAFDRPAGESPIPTRYIEAAQQVARAVRFVQAQTGGNRVKIIAHSWGTIPAAKFASDHPQTVERLVLFAPILPRHPTLAPSAPTRVPAWRRVSVAEQLARFVADTPQGQPGVLAEPNLEHWGAAWLATDPDAAGLTPHAVKVPGGPQADLIASWNGAELYDPATLQGPVLAIRGEWDSMSSAADLERLAARMMGALLVGKVIPRSGHLAHLETNRTLLWETVNAFLSESRA